MGRFPRHADIPGMLTKTPKNLPPLPLILESLGRPHPRVVAKQLGVCERTAWQWQNQGTAPRPAHLALYWVSPYGWELIDSDREYLSRQLRGWVDALQAENKRLQREVAYALALNHTGAANAPLMRHEPLLRSVPA